MLSKPTAKKYAHAALQLLSYYFLPYILLVPYSRTNDNYSEIFQNYSPELDVISKELILCLHSN